MAACFELIPCAPTLPIIYIKSSVQGFLPYVQQYVNIGGSCYQVLQSATASNCIDTILAPEESFTTCLECQGLLEAICGECPEYYVLEEIDGQQVCVKDEGSQPALFTGTLGAVNVGDTAGAYNQHGLNILEDITNKSWPIVGGQNNLTGQWWTALTNPNPTPSSYSNGGIGNGFFGNYCFRENWFNGPLVYGDTGYSYWSNTPVATTSQQGVDKKNWSTNIFASHGLSTQGRLNYGIATSNAQCSAVTNYYPNPIDGLNGFISPGPQCDASTRLDICFDVPETKQYLLGFSADNEIRILIKQPGDTVESPLLLLKGQNSNVLSPYTATSATNPTAIPAGASAALNVGWGQYHIVPITLTAGPNTITIIGISYQGSLGFVSDIINLTLAEFKTQFLDPVTGPTRTLQDLANVCIFSTQQYRPGANNPFNPTNAPIPQVPITSGNYYCEDGSVLACVAGGIPQCEVKSVIAFTECCYELTRCDEPSVIYTNTDLSQYQGQVLTLSGLDGCYIAEQSAEPCPQGSQPVTVSEAYSGCEECLVSYKLYNCKDQNITLQTAISAYVGKVVKADNFPGLCFTVEENPCNCLKITINGQVYNIDREENFFNGRPYFQFNTVNNLPIVIAYDSNELRWEVYNPSTQGIYFYSNLNIDCPTTSVWTKLDPTFPGDIKVEACTLRILNISPTEEFNDCECCVNC